MIKILEIPFLFTFETMEKKIIDINVNLEIDIRRNI